MSSMARSGGRAGLARKNLGPHGAPYGPPHGAPWAPVLFSAFAPGSFFGFWLRFFFWLLASGSFFGRMFSRLLGNLRALRQN